MLNLLVGDALTSIASELVYAVTKNLGKKYSTDTKYVLNEKIEQDFHKCLSVATKAFLEFCISQQEMSKEELIIFTDRYLKSSSVTEEIANLLEPGLEIFDRGKVTQAAKEIWQDEFDENMEQLIFNAWDEFLKAFSFASRSAPELREFLRASYEAGSFRALSNIEDVLEKMESTINIVKHEEITIKRALDEYTEELKQYRQWAIDFAKK